MNYSSSNKHYMVVSEHLHFGNQIVMFIRYVNMVGNKYLTAFICYLCFRIPSKFMVVLA